MRSDTIEHVGIANALDGKSDHRATFTKMQLRGYQPTRRRRKVQIGWAPELNEEGKPAKYHRALDTMLNNAHDPAAEIVEAATSSAAQCTRTRREHNEEVKALFERRRQEPDPLERKMLSKQLWFATLDVEKAFDRVHHASLFESLVDGKVDASIIGALRRLYANMRASVVLGDGQESRGVNVQRGVRQRDPLSPLLFNLVLNQVLEEVRTIWETRGYGTNVGATLRGRRLTHVAFADDMTLVSRSWLSMKRMVLTLREALARRGLALHPAKCKAQTNISELQQRGTINLDDGFSIEVLEVGASLELLGTSLNLDDATGHEVNNRIASAWRMFWSMKPLLMNRKVSIIRRLRLFDATVGSCATWCCESWTLRAAELRKMETARRSMLRKIVITIRSDAEEWVDWIIRATHRALEWSTRAGVRVWGMLHHSRKWAWAGHVARSGSDTWLYNIESRPGGILRGRRCANSRGSSARRGHRRGAG